MADGALQDMGLAWTSGTETGQHAGSNSSGMERRGVVGDGSVVGSVWEVRVGSWRHPSRNWSRDADVCLANFLVADKHGEIWHRIVMTGLHGSRSG